MNLEVKLDEKRHTYMLLGVHLFTGLTINGSGHWKCLINHGNAGWFLYNDLEITKCPKSNLPYLLTQSNYLYYIDVRYFLDANF
jgi:hypothetical protein